MSLFNNNNNNNLVVLFNQMHSHPFSNPLSLFTAFCSQPSSYTTTTKLPIVLAPQTPVINKAILKTIWVPSSESFSTLDKEYLRQIDMEERDRLGKRLSLLQPRLHRRSAFQEATRELSELLQTQLTRNNQRIFFDCIKIIRTNQTYSLSASMSVFEAALKKKNVLTPSVRRSLLSWKESLEAQLSSPVSSPTSPLASSPSPSTTEPATSSVSSSPSPADILVSQRYVFPVSPSSSGISSPSVLLRPFSPISESPSPSSESLPRRDFSLATILN
jgi:hypothetical protein